ncbi:MAG TPA: hypothetical protein ENN80_03240, partial [Candidatus Hydrogenedentes bacterium]|nr:hypothetical protein [Candidatus Hydrogenedentota bacterium]
MTKSIPANAMWSDPPRAGLVVTCAPLEIGAEQANIMPAKARAALEGLPIELVVVEAPVFDIPAALGAAERLIHANIDLVVWLAATWSFDSLALEFLRLCPAPLLAWGLPGMETGSLCGSQQLIEVLTELERPCVFVHGALGDASAHARIFDFARAAAASQRLKRARFGMLGHRTAGMTEVAFHEYDLARQFGVLVYYRGAERLLADAATTPTAGAEIIWSRTKQRCGKCAVSDEEGLQA